ncbi:hypothetical protein COLU111180_09260 [Cohnella lubricantis]|nr:hypothetical protein [Cohnella lubricantis]MBP2118350.1 hypothetical protein [Cohnella lubricantis]
MNIVYREAVHSDSPEIARLSHQLGYPAADEIEQRLVFNKELN